MRKNYIFYNNQVLLFNARKIILKVGQYEDIGNEINEFGILRM